MSSPGNRRFTAALLLPLLGLTTFAVHNEATAQPDLEWAVGIGGTGVDAGRGVAVDGAGNVYAAGFLAVPTSISIPARAWWN